MKPLTAAIVTAVALNVVLAALLIGAVAGLNMAVTTCRDHGRFHAAGEWWVCESEKTLTAPPGAR